MFSVARSKLSMMRAVIVSKFGGIEVLEVRRGVPKPSPGPNEVLVEVVAIGVNPIDTYIRSGNYSRLPKLPYCPGSDVAGTVEKVGSNVQGFTKGDRVASFMKIKSGGYAEYCVVHPDWLIHLPDDFDFRQGAAVGTPYFTAHKALFGKAQAKPNDTVLIHGASGGVGIAACQLASSQGITVMGTAGSEEGLSLLESQGLEHIFNHKEDGYTSKILEATNGKGPNIILEMLSNVNLNEDLKMIAPNGVIVIIGCRGPIEINPRLLMGKESKIQGVALASTTPEEFSIIRKIIGVGMKQGWVDPVIGPEYSLNSVQQAHNDIIHSKAKGKMIMLV